ncbi:rhodanese-like domain-containing protein [Geomonas sp. Red32]|uniref:rhodanese-like domain-containing protein n=1 Tax=Geomonas sp. Red32 TaxID=2912856 RepID=UPI00202CD813|nr:rhodanese-like domain-containing protein [Geomonas sp. Red32]
MKNSLLVTSLEIAAIVLIAAVLGIGWNRTLLASAWKGEAAIQQPASPQAQTAQAGGEELVPMPIPLAQVKDMHDGKQAVVIDARSASTFIQGHIAGAVSLPLEEARKNPSSLKGRFSKDATIIAYCNGFSCHDSMDLGKLMMQAGYANVYVYEGGFPEWRDSGYPVAKGGA